MSKMRVHELAKELGRANKEIIDFLTGKGMEIKSHMSMLEEDQVELVKKGVGSRPAPVKREPAPQTQAPEGAKPEGERPEGAARPAQPPKKKNITRIFRSQNSRTGIQKPAGMRTVDDRPARPAGRPGEAQARPGVRPGARPADGTARPGARPADGMARPAARSADGTARPGARPADGTARPAARPADGTARPAARPAEGAARPAARPADGAVRPAAKSAEGTARPVTKPAEEAARPAEGAAQTAPVQAAGTDQRPAAAKPQAESASRTPAGTRAESAQPAARQGAEGTRPAGRPAQQRDGRQQGFGSRDSRDGGQGRGFGDRDNRDGRGGRGFGGRDNRDGGQGRSFGDRDGRGGRGFGGRDSRDGGQGRSFGDRDGRGGRNFGDRDSRGQNRGGKNLSIPQPDLGSKPVTKESRIRTDKEKEKDKDKYSRRDRFDRQEKPQGRGSQKNSASGKNQKTAGRFIKPVTPPPAEKKEDEVRTVILPDRMTVRELADILKVQAAAIVKKLFLQGTMVTVNHEIEYDLAEEIALEYNCIAEHEEKVDVIGELLKEEEDAEETLVARPPVVCVMGHVDHGKTSLLDAIRNTHVIAKEAGGITQHIGAYTVSVNGQRITFLDTPGHEAFTAMRMRGANATDIAILVVAADDGVMPQTVEAISHAKAAGTEIIVAINKIDKPSANIDRVKQELSEYGLIPEDWGGSTVFVPVSAHTHEGLDTLLEMILLTAEVLELKANPDRKARGLVIEAELDKGKGPVATVLVQKGILRVGDAVAAGACFGKVRAMMDDKGRRVKEAGPSTPVEILGLSDVPNAGEVFVACENDKDARSFAETFISQSREKLLEETRSRMSLDDLFSQIQAGNVKELNIIVKADVQGSVEAVKQSLLKLSNDEVAVKIIHGGVGAINESDVSLASASNAIIIGFNVRPDATAKATAERENVDVRLYRVIYDAIADVEAAMKGMLDPIYEEKVIGHAEVRQIFKASGVGTIAGSYVLDGVFQRNCSVRISREGEQIFEGALASLKRFKDDVKEVRAGYECGLVFEKFNDVKEFDQIEAYIMVEVPR